MLSNAYFVAKFRFDTAENEPAKNLQKFTNVVKILQNLPILLMVPLRPAGLGPQAPAGEGVLLGAALRGAPAAGKAGHTTADRQNFSKMLLVFGCIGTDLCKKIRVLQHFSKSTRLSS